MVGDEETFVVTDAEPEQLSTLPVISLRRFSKSATNNFQSTQKKENSHGRH